MSHLYILYKFHQWFYEKCPIGLKSPILLNSEIRQFANFSSIPKISFGASGLLWKFFLQRLLLFVKYWRGNKLSTVKTLFLKALNARTHILAKLSLVGANFGVVERKTDKIHTFFLIFTVFVNICSFYLMFFYISFHELFLIAFETP